MRRVLLRDDWDLSPDTRLHDFAPPNDLERALGLGGPGRLLFVHGEDEPARFREDVIVRGLDVLGVNLAGWFDLPVDQIVGRIEATVPPAHRYAIYLAYRDGPK